MSAYLYLEGGGTGDDSKNLQIGCREAFRKLLVAAGFKNRLPRLFASGGRNAVFNDFQTAIEAKSGVDYVAMWIDSEDPVANLEAAWEHLAYRDNWERPAGATDDQVLFMTTCMETWIVVDRTTLLGHYRKIQQSALPTLVDLEQRGRHNVQDALSHATRNCSNAYAKGKRSFEIVAKLNPDTLAQHLPSFVRIQRILNDRL